LLLLLLPLLGVLPKDSTPNPLLTMSSLTKEDALLLLPLLLLLLLLLLLPLSLLPRVSKYTASKKADSVQAQCHSVS
jgi:hypothetical protein